MPWPGGGNEGRPASQIEGAVKVLADAKGDLIAATAADTLARLGVGTNGQVLKADSAEATGLKWGGAMSIKDIDGTPTIASLTLEFPNGTVTDQGGGVARYTPTALAGPLNLNTGDPVINLDTTQAQVAYDGDHLISNGSGISTTQRNWDHTVTVTATDIAAAGTLISSGLRSQLGFGVGGVASVGTGHAATLENLIQGAGNNSNEYTPLFTLCRADIGTGYTQTAGPVGRLWGADHNVHGPIEVQPHLLNGATHFINNYYNGSPASTASGGLWMVTRKGSGGGRDAIHEAATTYPIDVGIGIVGTSGATNTGIGFTTGIKIGGTGSGWGASSRFGTAIDISDWETYGLRVSGRTAAATGPAISINPNCGAIVVGSTTGSFVSTALLEVLGENATARDPMVAFRMNGADRTSLSLGNTGGNWKLATAGATSDFFTGTVAGDAAIVISTSGKALHIGGTAKVITVTQANTLGVFNTTPVTQRTGWGTPSGTLTRTTFDPATATLPEGLQRLAALITDLKTYGWLGA